MTHLAIAAGMLFLLLLFTRSGRLLLLAFALLAFALWMHTHGPGRARRAVEEVQMTVR
jgi:hypothetical protein